MYNQKFQFKHACIKHQYLNLKKQEIQASINISDNRYPVKV